MIALFLKILINQIPNQFPWSMAVDMLSVPYNVVSSMGL